jgi:high-affinity K+ transport system ATPase subunit B
MWMEAPAQTSGRARVFSFSLSPIPNNNSSTPMSDTVSMVSVTSLPITWRPNPAARYPTSGGNPTRAARNPLANAAKMNATSTAGAASVSGKVSGKCRQLTGACPALQGTWVIAAVLLLNAGIGFVQEQRAESSVRALGSLVSNAARVLRDGHERQVPAREVVPGDVVLLESGVRVAADLRLLHVTELRIDESLLTGESVPVSKSTSPVADSTSLADRTSMAYAGSMVTSGRGRGLVVATGGDSTLGFIAELMRSEESPDSPLQRRMARFARVVGLVVASAAILSFGLGILAGFPASEMFRFSVALAVAAIPEGLPIVLTITLAVGVNRMSQRNALIRRLAAVETLGSTTVIGSDKTGTLTENRMTVETIWAAGAEWAISDAARSGSGMHSSRAVQETLIVGTLANEAHLYLEDGDVVTTGDPTEAALLMAAFRCGIDPGELHDRFVVHASVPFESERRYSAVFGELEGRRLVYVKGAPERIIELSDRMLDGDGTAVAFDRDLVADAADRMASGGLRVLAMAMLESGRLRRLRPTRCWRSRAGDHFRQPDLRWIAGHARSAPSRGGGRCRRLPPGRDPTGDDHRRSCRHGAGHRHPARHRHRVRQGVDRCRARHDVRRGAATGRGRRARVRPCLPRAQASNRPGPSCRRQRGGGDR